MIHGRHTVRVYTRDTLGIGVCDEVFYVDCDPVVFARRLLLVDEMREEGCGYTRAEVDREGYFTRTVRTRRRQRVKAATWGAWRRGVFGARRRDALLASERGRP